MDSAIAALRAGQAQLIALTRKWVEVNSFTENREGVQQVGGMLQGAFALPSLKCEVVPDPGGKYGDHLIWRTAAAATQPAILLVGHHDTVFPPGHFEGWKEDGNGRAIGPGALDMKGGLSR